MELIKYVLVPHFIVKFAVLDIVISNFGFALFSFKIKKFRKKLSPSHAPLPV